MSRRLTRDESRRRYAEGKKLWNEFDPIGVFQIDSNWPKDEYDGYVGPMLRLCEEGKSSADLTKYVEYVVYDRMGLSPAPERDEGIADFVLKFRNWYKASWPDTTV